MAKGGNGKAPSVKQVKPPSKKTVTVHTSAPLRPPKGGGHGGKPAQGGSGGKS